jgi:hypothetical protein
VLNGWVAGQGWKRSKSKDASGWEHDGQIIRELKTPQALFGMGANNCKLIVVKPEKRGGHMPDPMVSKSIAEAQKRGVPIEVVTCPTRDAVHRRELQAPRRARRVARKVIAWTRTDSIRNKRPGQQSRDLWQRCR